jgi:hypothetical protein
VKVGKSGIIQRLIVEGDSHPILLGALIAATARDTKASHYIIGKNKSGENYLSLRWCDAEKALPLVFPLNTADELCDFATQWLEKSAIYPDVSPDTDGSVTEGFRVSRDDFYEIARITPTYIIYGK